jgi:hypothetical protein
VNKNILNHNFVIGPCDTDSVSYCKQDMSPFTSEEIDNLLSEIKQLSPEFMEWEDDGYYDTCIVLRAKNYVLWDGKKKSIKGSAFKTSSKEIALKEMMEEMIDAMIFRKEDQLTDIYHKYIKEALNVTNISRWAQKKTITRAILDCASGPSRKNESNVWDAIKGEQDIQEGNKVLIYPVILGKDVQAGRISEKTGKPLKDKSKEITGLKLIKYWNDDQNCDKLIERVYDTVCIFEKVLDMNKFVNYGLVKNKKLLETL